MASKQSERDTNMGVQFLAGAIYCKDLWVTKVVACLTYY